MRATEDWLADDLAPGCLLLRLSWWTQDMLVHALVRPGMVEVGLMLLHRSIEMPLAQDEEKVQAFSPHTTQKALTHGVGLRRLTRRGQDLYNKDVDLDTSARAWYNCICVPIYLDTWVTE
jgi:hypothetical protein